MSTNLEDSVITTIQKPQVFLKSIIFNDETQLPVSYTHLTLPTICSV